MKLIPISAGHFHCDGGALFGAIPKVMWNKVYPCNDDNFTQLTLRCLLVEIDDRKILIEAGIGNHYPEKHLKNNGVTSVDELEISLADKSYSTNDITDVFFTHLHWDHCTGAVKNINGKMELLFPNATLWSSKTQWEHAKISNPRERAAFHRPVLDFMMESGKLQLIEKEGEFLPGFEIILFNGHTPGQMLPIFHTEKHSFVYTSDLITTAANIPLLWISAYDLDPAQVMEEKGKFLQEAAEKNYILFFEHDYYTECASVHKTEKGVQLKEKYNLVELI